MSKKRRAVKSAAALIAATLIIMCATAAMAAAGDYAITDAIGTTVTGNVLTPVTASDVVASAKSAAGGASIIGVYSFKAPADGVSPYSLKFSVGDVNSATAYELNAGAWSRMSSTYSAGYITVMIQPNDVIAIAATAPVTATVLLPAGTKYYTMSDAQPGTPGMELTLAYDTAVTMGRTFSTGYTEITMGGQMYLIKTYGATPQPQQTTVPVTPGQTVAPSQTVIPIPGTVVTQPQTPSSTNPPIAGTVSQVPTQPQMPSNAPSIPVNPGTSPKTGDEAGSAAWLLIAVAIGSAAAVLAAKRIAKKHVA